MENQRLIASVLLLICVLVVFVGATDTLQQERPKRQLLGALLHGLSHGGGGHGGNYGKFDLNNDI